MKRRTFLRAVGSAVGAGAMGGAAAEATEELISEKKTAKEAMPRRVLGRTGERVSIIGYPGFALAHGEQHEGTRSIRRAFERGVNYYDVAPAYGNGDAEIKMGIGLQGIDRSKIFLACKTKMRDKDGAGEELERSLKRLKTDHFDLYQMHCLIKPEEVDQALSSGGAMETFLKAKEEGKVRYLGFSAHTTKAALAAMQRFRFDTVMFPINYVEYFTFAFGKPVLELAHEQGAAVLAIKPMSGGNWTGEAKADRKKRHRNWWYRTLEDKQDIDLALRFTLAQKAVVAGIPPAWLDLAERAFEAGRNYRPITEEETEKLRQMAAKSESVFHPRQQVAYHWPGHGPHSPEVAHECCPGMYA